MKVTHRSYLKKKSVPSGERPLTKVIVRHYPKTFHFYVTGKLPAFKPFCEIRTMIVQGMLHLITYRGEHFPEDFVVEQSEQLSGSVPRTEVWELGS